MSAPVVDTLDVSSLSFGVPYRQKNGQMIVPASMVPGRFDFDSRLRFQIGKDQDHMLHTTYGVNSLMEGQKEKDVNRRNMDVIPTPDMEAKLREIDAAVKRACEEKCNEFFKTSTLTKEYVPLVKDGASGPTVRVKIQTSDNPTEVRVFTSDNQVKKDSYSAITRDSDIIAIADTPGIWFNHQQFGMSLVTRSILVRPPMRRTGIGMFNLNPGVVEVEEERPELMIE